MDSQKLHNNYGTTNKINTLCNIVATTISNSLTFVTPEVSETLDINMEEVNNTRKRIRNISNGNVVNQLEPYICELLYKAGRYLHLLINNEGINTTNMRSFKDVKNDIAIIISEQSNSYYSGWVKESI